MHITTLKLPNNCTVKYFLVKPKKQNYDESSSLSLREIFLTPEYVMCQVHSFQVRILFQDERK